MGEKGVEGCERSEVDRMVGVDGKGLWWEGAHSDMDRLLWALSALCGMTGDRKRGSHPFYYPCSHACDISLDNFISWCADRKGTPWVYRRKEGIAVLEAVFDVGEGFVELFDEPVEFPFLSGEVYQYPRRGNIHSYHRV